MSIFRAIQQYDSFERFNVIVVSFTFSVGYNAPH